LSLVWIAWRRSILRVCDVERLVLAVSGLSLLEQEKEKNATSWSAHIRSRDVVLSAAAA
jgi:hypothetical protein